MNYNKAILVGRVTQDPEIKSLPSGSNVASFGLATNRYWKGTDGSRQEETQFHNIVLFGRSAEIAQQYVQKGSEIMIEGRIQYRSWEAQDGTKRYRTEIVGEQMQLGAKPGVGGGGPAANANTGNAAPSKPTDVPVVSQDDATPGSATKAKSKKGSAGAADDDEINIEEDIPF